jgi:hypothetical protein
MEVDVCRGLFADRLIESSHTLLWVSGTGADGTSGQRFANIQDRARLCPQSTASESRQVARQLRKNRPVRHWLGGQ